MDEIKDMDLKAIVDSAVIDVFDTMLSIELKAFEVDSQITVEGDSIKGIVRFDGEATGSVSIHADKNFAVIMTSSMLGMEPEEIEGDDEVNDVLSEVISIIGGNIKTSFSGMGLPFELSTPVITSNGDSQTESTNFDRHERFAFHYQEYIIFVEVYITLAESNQTAAVATNEQPAEQETSQDQFQVDDDDSETDDKATDEATDENGQLDDFQVDDDSETDDEATDEDEQLDDFQIDDDDDSETDDEANDENGQLDDFQVDDGADLLNEFQTEDKPDKKLIQKQKESQDQFQIADDNEAEFLDQFETSDDDDDDSQDMFQTLDDDETGDEYKEIDEENEEDEKIEETTEEKKKEEEKYEKLPQDEEKSHIKSILIAVLVFACLIGWFIYEKKFAKVKETTFELHKQESENVSDDLESKESADLKSEESAPQNTIDDVLEKADNLRDELFIKQKHIAELKQYYQDGIYEMENNVLKEANKKRITSYNQAIKNKYIALGLRTIQRRQAYMRQLDRPHYITYLGSEELLYLKRQTEINAKMNDIAEGVDMNKSFERIRASAEKYGLINETLSVDTENLTLKPLPNIWKEINAGRRRPAKKQVLLSNEDKKNHEIWQDIYEGNFDRMFELTQLSPKAARSLSQWEGKILSLNNLSNLSLEAAKYLSQWDGEWLSLNGLTTISDNAARYLSQWDGEWLSLNGLVKLSPKAAKYLSQCRGKQLEMVSLMHLASVEQSGGGLSIPDKLKERINKSAR